MIANKAEQSPCKGCKRYPNFLYTVLKRYDSMGYNRAALKLTMAHRDIANFLGLTVETLCRQLALLDRMEIINIKQRRI